MALRWVGWITVYPLLITLLFPTAAFTVLPVRVQNAPISQMQAHGHDTYKKSNHNVSNEDSMQSNLFIWVAATFRFFLAASHKTLYGSSQGISHW